ncbi:MAG: serine/threonine-protein kinase [Planctomycetota bacterium]|nr:serine/threonine-protein kinase [Planctomycetota bacterium]
MSSFQETKSGTHPFPDRSSSSRQNSRSGSQSATDQQAANLAIGTRISGRFQIVKRLGLGGMGAVYQVKDLESNEDRALKVMMPSLLLDKASCARFQREAEVMRSLGGQGIVQVFDIGDDQSLGLKYYSMELLSGLSLRELLNECQDHKIFLDQKVALEITRQTVVALLPAHEQKIIHRDLKPDNIFLRGLRKSDALDLRIDEIDLLILDFGIAKANDQLHLTQTQASFGTVAYMAPEQQMSARKVDHRADQFSIGIILHELLCQRIPMEESASEQEISGPRARELRRFLVRALHEEPEQRFPNTEATLDAIEDLLEPKKASRSILMATCILSLAVMTVFVLHWIASSNSERSKSNPTPTQTPSVVKQSPSVVKKSPAPKVVPAPKIRPPKPLWRKLSSVDMTTKTKVNYSHLSIDHLSSKVYVSGQFARGYVTIIDTKDPRYARMRKRSLGSGVMVVEEADRYYISSGYRGELLTYSIETNKEIGRLKIGFCGGYQALDKKKRLLYMASQCGNGNDPVHVFKADTGELATEKPLRSGKVCLTVHVNSKTGLVYIGRDDNKTLVLDPGASYKVIKYLPGLVAAIDELNNRIIVNMSPQETRFIDANTHKIIAQTFRQFGSISIASNQDRAYCGLKNKLSILGLSSFKAIGHYVLPESQKIDFVSCDEKRRLIFLVVSHDDGKKSFEIIKDQS